MAQLSLRERLQPALLDRLIDDDRLLTVYEFKFRRAELKRLGISERDVAGILSAQGLRVDDDDPRTGGDAETLQLTRVSPGGRVSLSQLKALVLKPPAQPQGVALHSFCEIAARNVINRTAE